MIFPEFPGKSVSSPLVVYWQISQIPHNTPTWLLVSALHSTTPLSPHLSPGRGARARLGAAVQELLSYAYGAELGKTGHQLAGHAVDEVDVQSVLEGGSSLLYGELLPEGVRRLQEAFFEEQELEGPILELGMGTGKVALQLFLAPSATPQTAERRVYGVELAPSRYARAAAAAERLSGRWPERFRREVISDTSCCLWDSVHGTPAARCDLVCGSLLDTPEKLLREAAAVVLEVCLPSDVQNDAGRMLQALPNGCRVVSYSALHQLTPHCRLRPVGDGGLTLPSSWKPSGHLFAFYEANDAGLGAADAPRLAELRGSGGCPSRARRLRYTDEVLGAPELEVYPWQKGDQVLVGYSWLPFPDLGDPDEATCGTLDGVTWMDAVVVLVHEDCYVNVCYEDTETLPN
ncbi:unnamed protein product [Durusdinium trenchii]|uniref:Uncharacterized protein n=1 Tax=Durusdinium trenchii TaxID=1381693 RepID=A0ABP0Q2B4_9DINO